MWFSQPLGVISCTALHVLYCTLQYCTLLYCTVLYRIAMYCTLLYSTVLYISRVRVTAGYTSHPGCYDLDYCTVCYTYPQCSNVHQLLFIFFTSYHKVCLFSALSSSFDCHILFLTFFTYHLTITGRRSRNLKFEFLPGDLATYWDAEGVDRTVRIKERLSTCHVV